MYDWPDRDEVPVRRGRRPTTGRPRRRGAPRPGPATSELVDPDAAEDEEERGEQPPGAAHPERSQRDAPARAPLAHEQARDEEPAQHEEEVDAEEAAGRDVRSEVVEHDGEHRDARAGRRAPGCGGTRRAGIPASGRGRRRRRLTGRRGEGDRTPLVGVHDGDTLPAGALQRAAPPSHQPAEVTVVVVPRARPDGSRGDRDRARACSVLRTAELEQQMTAGAQQRRPRARRPGARRSSPSSPPSSARAGSWRCTSAGSRRRSAVGT